MWILVSEVNDYNQHGRYFEAAWEYGRKPSPSEISLHTGLDEEHSKWILETGGGRKGREDQWYELIEYI